MIGEAEIWCNGVSFESDTPLNFESDRMNQEIFNGKLLNKFELKSNQILAC